MVSARCDPAAENYGKSGALSDAAAQGSDEILTQAGARDAAKMPHHGLPGEADMENTEKTRAEEEKA